MAEERERASGERVGHRTDEGEDPDVEAHKLTIDRQSGERASGERASGERASGERVSGERASGERESMD